MKTRHSLLAVAPLLTSLLTVGCGKGGAIGRLGDLGLQGVSSGRCVPNNEQPFGPARTLTASERQRVYEFLKIVDDVNSAEMGAESAVLGETDEPRWPSELVLRESLQSGQCTGSGSREAHVGGGLAFDFSGESCPVAYRRVDTKGEDLAGGLMLLRLESSIRFQDPNLIGGDVRARHRQEDAIIYKNQESELRITCHVNRSSIALADGSTVETFSLLETVVEGGRGESRSLVERRERRLLKFPDFTAELEGTRRYTNDSEARTSTLNGDPVLAAEVEATGMKVNRLHFDNIGFHPYTK